MIRFKFNSNWTVGASMTLSSILILGLLGVLCVPAAWGASVTPETARKVAEGQVRHHMAVFESWNGSVAPRILDSYESIEENGTISAYLFRIHPTGYVIVAAHDNLSPIPFYSTRSEFDVSRADQPSAIESWMVTQLNVKAAAAENLSSRADRSAPSSQTSSGSRTRDAWTYFNRLSTNQQNQGAARSLSIDAARTSDDVIIRGDTVGPLLTTIWGQGTPYNAQAPKDGCVNDSNTLTGCVATAWAQLLRYWQWPPQNLRGEGVGTYSWNGVSSPEQELSVDYTNTEAYDWGNMPDDLTAPETNQEQIDAVSRLIYYLGVSAEMDFGCPESPTGSGSSQWAYDVLDRNFRFKPMDETTSRRERENFTAEQWFDIIKDELSADPARPVVFSLASQLGWHEALIDGFEEGEGVLNRVHVNFGWDGLHDAYYDITDDDDFDTTPFNWQVSREQVLAIGIEPDNNPPVVQAGDDATVEEDAVVNLSVVSASDPEDIGISGYQWTQVSGPTAAIADENTDAPVITTPNVNSVSQLVFQVRVTDVNRAVGTDTCTITVNNTDGDTAPPNGGGKVVGGGGGGGGCFLSAVIH